MPRIRVILEDDNGVPLSDLAEQVYPLDSNCDSLTEIESSVEHYKRLSLPEIERRLLAHAQERHITREKRGRAGGGTV